MSQRKQTRRRPDPAKSRRKPRADVADQARRALIAELGGPPETAARFSLRKLRALDDLAEWIRARDEARTAVPSRFDDC